MSDQLTGHYAGDQDLVQAIALALQRAGKPLGGLKPADLRSFDEFHVRGHRATLELIQALRPTAGMHVLDIGSGLGGPARALAELHGCKVTGIDLTEAYSAAATAFSHWVGLSELVSFLTADATSLPFADASFDAAMTIHVGMNVAAKDLMYAQARRVLKPRSRFVVYDVVRGEGGPARHPLPWARLPSQSHLANREAMCALLAAAGFRLLETVDSSAVSQRWFEEMASRRVSGPSPVTLKTVLGADFPLMTENLRVNLREQRLCTVMFVCEAGRQ